jgi:hypothetical protein
MYMKRIYTEWGWQWVPCFYSVFDEPKEEIVRVNPDDYCIKYPNEGKGDAMKVEIIEEVVKLFVPFKVVLHIENDYQLRCLLKLVDGQGPEFAVLKQELLKKFSSKL